MIQQRAARLRSFDVLFSMSFASFPVAVRK
jgi:hypothetical protein